MSHEPQETELAATNDSPTNDQFDDHAALTMTMVAGGSFFIPSSSRIDLVWKNTSVGINDRYILQQANGHISEGLIAIMGPSGSGKTTLLNCLACRSDPGCVIEGILHINGEPYNLSKLKKYLGYVMQDDVQNPLLTVRETLGFVCEVRTRHNTTQAERDVLVNDALIHLSLVHCADVLVGSGNDGISAGERKRLSVACELLSKPKILFLDEPTSNLDSLDALHFVRSMRNLVDQTGCVIVCTIHQPQYKVFSTFDRLIMVRSGLIVYDGAIRELQSYCEELGQPCPGNVNPADHFMEIVAPNPNDSFNTEMRKQTKFGISYLKDRVFSRTDAGLGREESYVREAPAFVSRLIMCFNRSWLLLKRRRAEWIGNLFITIVNAVLVGTVFLQIGRGELSIQKRNSALFFGVVNQATFGAIGTVALLPSERPVVLRERAAGNTSALAYFLAKAIAEMLWKFPFPVIFSLITYFLIGFQSTGSGFFRHVTVVVLAFWTGMGVAMCVSALSKVSSVASLVMPLVMEVCRLFSSFFVPLADLPMGLKWIVYTSYVFYSYNAVAQSEMDNKLLDPCPALTNPSCRPRFDLEQRGQHLTYDESVGILVVYMFISLFVAYLAVRLLRK